MKMLIGGTWQAAASGRTEDVTSPFDGTVTGTVPVAGPEDVRAALDRAEAGAVTWRRTPAHERMRILLRAAELADERAEQTRRSSAPRPGRRSRGQGRGGRSGDLIRLAAFEGTQLYGDSLPLDANRGTGLDKIGFTIHQPSASWWRSPRSTTRPCWSCTSWRRPWRRATRSCSSRPGPPR
jgi:NAD-dependent aldehyde dehydrogenases